MSMYEMHYVNSSSEQIRLKEQQKKMLKALQELSVSTKLQEQHSTHHRLDTWYQGAPDIAPECRPYSPYSVSYATTSIASSILSRQRTPSMSSANSSLVSENESEKDLNYETTERDQYGFKRPIQWVSPKQLYEFDIKYKPMLLKQAKHWNKLFANNDQQWPTLCPELTRYVRKGIPQSFRTKAWMHYSGADNRMKANTGVYTSLIAQDCENAQTIERDLHGSFPGNSFFPQDSETNKLKMLQRILCAFSLYVPEIGYRQSLIFIAGFLLVFQDEEEAFWLLVTAIKDFFPKDMFSSSSSEQTILMMMVYEKMPGVWSKIANKKCFWECQQTDSLPSVTLVTDHWFSTMFVNVLPVETVMRIWDCFFVGEGFKVLYQVALTIMKLNERSICNVADSVDIIQLLQKSPKRLIDCHEFIKSVFSPQSITDDITLQEINRIRALFRNRKN